MSTPFLSWFAEGLGAMFDPVADLAYDVSVDGQPDFVPGYGALLDPTICDPSNLPYLGQFVGAVVPPGSDAATALSVVTTEAGLNRGTIAAITAAVTRTLTGTQFVNIQERLGPDGTTPDAYWLLINVNSTEANITAITAAVNAIKPGGVFFTVVASTSVTWSQATLTWNGVANGVTWANVASGEV